MNISVSAGVWFPLWQVLDRRLCVCGTREISRAPILDTKREMGKPFRQKAAAKDAETTTKAAK